MSRSIRLNFDNASDWVFDSSKIEFNGSVAKMILQDNIGQTFNQAFTSDSGFTYDSAKAEFVAGKVQQKSQVPAGALLGANFNIGKDANFSEDSPTGTLYSGAVVSGGKLDCTAGANSACRFVGNNNLPTGQGCIRFRFTPNHTALYLGYLFATNGLAQMYLLLNTNGSLRLTVKNDVGGVQFDGASGGRTWVQGQEYEIEMNWSGTFANLYVDKTRIVNDTSAVGTKTTNGDTLYIGTYSNGGAGVDASFDDLIIFDTPQHTGATYSEDYTVPDYIYTTSKVELPQFSYSDIGNLQAFTAFAVTDSNSPKYVLNDLYYNSGWVSSDGSYAQANSSAEVIANIASLPASNTLDIDVAFDDGNSQMSVDDLTSTYTGQIYPTTDLPIESVDSILSDDFMEFEESTTAPVNTSIKWVFKFSDNSYYYYNGAAWVSSNLSAAQANTEAEVNTGFPTLISGNYEQIKPVAILSSDGSDTPEATYAQIVYSFYALEPATGIPTTTLYFYIKDLLNIDFSEATFFVSSKKSFYHTERLVLPVEQSSEANSDGYIELDVIETESVNKKLNFKLEYTDPNDNTTKTVNFKTAIVPNQLTTKGDEILVPK